MNRRSTNFIAILILLVIVYGIWLYSRLPAREALSMPLEDANSLQVIGGLDAVHYKLDSKEDVEIIPNVFCATERTEATHGEENRAGAAIF